MKRTWYIFKEYYLIYILVYVAIMSIIYFVDYQNYGSDIDKFKFLTIFVFIFIMMLSSIEYIKQEYYKSWRIKQLLNKTPIIEFLNYDFHKKNNFIVGQLNDYTVIVGVEWRRYQKSCGYYYQVLFDPYVNSKMLDYDECVNYQEEITKIKLEFNLNCIEKYYGARKMFLRKEHKDILSDIYNTIQWLTLKDFKSINFIDWIDLIPKVNGHSEKFYSY